MFGGLRPEFEHPWPPGAKAHKKGLGAQKNNRLAISDAQDRDELLRKAKAEAGQKKSTVLLDFNHAREG